MPLSSTRLDVVLGASFRLRDALVADLLAGWSGPVKRLSDPEDPGRLVLDLDTPSLFEEPALWLVRLSQPWFKRHRTILVGLAGQPVAAGRVVVSLAALEGPGDLAKKLDAVGALHRSEPPGPREVVDWLSARLLTHPQGVERPRVVAEALHRHLGDDVDALLAAVEVVAVYAGVKAIDAAAVEAVIGGLAERPIWEFTSALFDGDARTAIELLHAGGIEAERTLAGLLAELRKLLACAQTSDDGEAIRWAGARGRPNLYHVRNRARSLGQPLAERLLGAAALAQRRLRQSGTDPATVLELLVLHAQRLIRAKVR